MMLAPGEQRQIREPPLRSGNRGPEKPLQRPGEPQHGRGVEQLRHVFQHAGEPPGGLRQGQKQIVFGAGVFGTLQRLQTQVGKLQGRHRSVLERKPHLEQRRAQQTALRAQLFDQSFERQVLVRISAQREFASTSHQRGEIRISRQAQPKRQGVDEETDQIFGFQPVAVCHRRAHHHLLLTRQARQQTLPAGQKHHERRRGERAPQTGDAPRQLRGEADRYMGSAPALHRRARAVQRQLQLRGSILQALPPPGQLRLQHLSRQPAPLPDRVVRVLHRQPGKRRLPALHTSRVQLAQLAHQHSHRPAVRDDVVHRYQDPVVLGLQTQQRHAHQRAPRQVERTERLCRLQPMSLLRSPPGRQRREIDQRRLDRSHRDNLLHRTAIQRREPRPQRLVATDHPRQRPP